MIAALFLVLAVVAAIRWRLLNFPLERDEGEYAYAGQLLLQGVPPYQDAYSMKWPGTGAAYALIMALFGQTAAGIRVGLILVNLATGVLVFLLGRRVCGAGPGAVAAATYALLSISPGTLGLMAHATHFVMLPALLGILLLQNLDGETSRRRIFFVGLLLGIAALMKQSGAAFGLFAASWIVWCELLPGNRRWRRLAIRLGCLALGGLLPVILTCSVLALAGVFGRFWLWTYHYAAAYASVNTFATRVSYLRDTVGALFGAAPGLWSAVGLGLVLLFCDRSLRRWRFFVLSLLFCSCLAVCPGGYFRPHYFLQVLPAAGLLAGVAVYVATGRLQRLAPLLPPATIPHVLFAAAALWSLFASRNLFFQLTPEQACCVLYGPNPFPESVVIGRYLASNCSPNARVAVIGSEPQVYFYSQRRSATGYIYVYPLTEPQPYALDMQKEMIREIERSHPEYIVLVRMVDSWGPSEDSNALVRDWFNQYQQERCELVGLVTISPVPRARYWWRGSGEPLPTPTSNYWLAIFRDRGAAETPPADSR